MPHNLSIYEPRDEELSQLRVPEGEQVFAGILTVVGIMGLAHAVFAIGRKLAS